jgi:hypothetical protein
MPLQKASARPRARGARALILEQGWMRFGGLARNRTGVQGFAVLCVATPPRGRMLTLPRARDI